MSFSKRAYGSPVLRGARDTEYDVLSKITRMLHKAPKTCESAETISAVSKNGELWTIFAKDLVESNNGLPDEVKAGLLSLSGFVLRHGMLVLSGKGQTDILIEINLSVMKGLRGGEEK
ncbi:MAG: flagellar biosynthesis regulator FlaF [Paracoccus sp. (in: a-proteobacteria)]|uniref:flagellar biosynthesis regulator FlaF n=1 Tax=Paracoccus sp. TaxID=267 RepID=UPI0039E2EFC2